MVLLEVGDCGFGAHDPVLVKAVAPPGTAVVRAAHAVELALPGLRGDGGAREQRVVVHDSLKDARRVDLAAVRETTR